MTTELLMTFILEFFKLIFVKGKFHLAKFTITCETVKNTFEVK